VLDVRQGELCWVVGTVYMEMAGKPNVLADIEKDVSIATSYVMESSNTS
jgi:DNA polymerase delta subunit 2